MKILKKLNSAERGTQKRAVVRRSLLFVDAAKILSAVSARIVLGK